MSLLRFIHNRFDRVFDTRRDVFELWGLRKHREHGRWVNHSNMSLPLLLPNRYSARKGHIHFHIGS